MASSCNFHLYMPEDLLIEILCRLPAKSLLRFKCVCKYWCSLIQSPYFVGKHIHHPKNHRRLLVHRCIDHDEQNDGNDLFPFVLFEETLAGNPPVHHNLDYMRSVHYLSHILGPVNGLFLLHNNTDDRNNRVALWNPATTEFRPLPPPLVFLHPRYDIKHVLGFGLDILTNDYKAVWIQINDCLDVNDPPVVCVQLYTLGTDSWRQIEIDDPVLLDSIVPLGEYNKSNMYFNGVYYWLSSFGCSCGCKGTIVSFDMVSDVFREVKKPDATAAIAQLFVLNNGSIAVASAEPELGSVDVWVMEKDQDFWTKHLTIGTENPLRFGNIIEFWNKKEIFFLTAETHQLVLYNTDTHEIRDLGIRHSHCCMPGALNYKESLVSVKGGQMESWNKDNMHDVIQDFSAVPWEENVPE